MKRIGHIMKKRMVYYFAIIVAFVVVIHLQYLMSVYLSLIKIKYSVCVCVCVCVCGKKKDFTVVLNK